MTRDHIVRKRLVALIGESPVVVVEAASGFGKTTLARSLSLGGRSLDIALGPLDSNEGSLFRRLRRAFARMNETAAVSALDDATAAVDDIVEALVDSLSNAAPFTLMIDDVHHLGEAAGVLDLFTQKRPAAMRLIVTARVLPLTVHPLVTRPGVVHVTSDDLRFDVSEARALLDERFGLTLADSDIESLVDRTGGWPAGLALAATHLARVENVSASVVGEDIVGRFADVVLAAVPASLRGAVVTLGHLPVLTDAVADAATGRPGILDEFLALGLPLSRGNRGHVRLPGALADALTRGTSLDPSAARRVAESYLAHDDAVSAIEALRLAGAHDDIASLLVEMPPAARRHLTADDIIAAIDVLPLATLAAHPAVLLEKARATARTGVPGAQRAALDRAQQVAGDPAPAALARAIDVERMTYEMYTLFISDREAQIRRIHDHVVACGPGEERTLGRALAIQGQQFAWAGMRGEADLVLRRAATVLTEQGDDATASSVLVQLGFNVHLHEQLSTAEETFARAVDLAGSQGRARATALTYLGEVKIWRGRLDEGATDLEEAADLARAARDARAHAYAAWGLALHSSLSENPQKTIAQVEQAGRLLREWIDTGVGATYAATMTDLLDRSGAHTEADRMYAIADARRVEAPELASLAEFGIAARRGDAALAEMLWRKVEADDGIEPFERVRCRLLRAYAALRRHDPELELRYRELLADGESLGADGVPWHLEPQATRTLELWWTRHHSTWRVRVLGPVEVTRDGVAIAIPAGRPLELVVLLALHTAPVPIDTVLDRLWGSSADDAALARLRQVLYRLRQVAPGLIVRADAALTFGPECSVDRVEFERLRAHAVAKPDAPGAARRALSLIDDEFFNAVAPPRITEVVDEVRGILRSQVVSLWEQRAESEPSPAVRIDCLFAAHELEPADSPRAERLALLLMDDNRVSEARAVVGSTLHALERLGVTAPARLLDMRSRFISVT